MDRETRKANLKKLRLSGIKHIGESNNLRKTRSDNASISKYFRVPITNEVKHTKPDDNKKNDCVDKLHNVEQLDSQMNSMCKGENLEKYANTRSRKRSSIKNVVLNDGTKIEDKTQGDSETCAGVFEIPSKKVKKTDKLRCSKNYLKSTKSRIPNKQLDIKTSLMRSEQIFSEITSQHCRVDNFSADEILLALALSKSQVETNGAICSDSNEEVADQHVGNKDHNYFRNVPNILRQYGFRTSSAEDYNSLASLFVPGANRRTKTKWVNKFTALTLRDSKLQTNKVRCKIESLMAKQLNYKVVDACESQFKTYSLISGELQKLKIAKVLTSTLASQETTNVEDFYVKSLFEVAHLQAGCLLKDWHIIQGRDRSPRGDNKSEIKSVDAKMNLIYMTLEEHFGMSGKLKPNENRNETAKNVKKSPIKAKETSVVELKPLYETTSLDSTQINNGIQSDSLSPDSSESTHLSKTRLVEYNIGSPTYSEHSTGLDLASADIFNPKDRDNFDNCSLKLNCCSTSQSTSDNHHAMSIRTCTLSPNIFASSEDESEEVTNTIITTRDHQGPTSNNIQLPENVKKPNTILQVIDLTQEEEEQHNISMDIQTNVFENIHVNRIEARNNNIETINWSNKNFVKINSDLYERKALSMIEINLHRNQKNIKEIVNESGIYADRLSVASNNTTSIAGKKKEKPSMGNLKKSASLPCNLERLYISKSTPSEPSLDDIQNEESETCEDYIVLSDDEINYSIWKADMSRGRGEFVSGDTKSETLNGKKKAENSHDFTTLDLIDGDNFMDNNINIEIDLEVPYNVSCFSHKTDRSNDLLEIGLLDNISQPFTPLHQAMFNNNLTPSQKAAIGLGELLTDDINLNTSTERMSPKKLYPCTPLSNLCNYPPDEYEIAGRKYMIRTVTEPKPNFMDQTEAEILKQLYGFGIKPLKRKQAIKMLEYIYNSTHPLMLTQTAVSKICSKGEIVPKAANVGEPEESKRPDLCQIVLAPNILQLNCCLSTNMLQFTKELQIEFENEDYVFQTNVTKKTPRPLLPLHIAWYNLVSSSTILHEQILMYTPIDLQEIYLFFKQLGHRFELKDMKVFLDRRCIIFRYDLAQPGRKSERHNRKSKTMAKKK